MEIFDAVSYFPDTGEFFWLISPSNHVPAGALAGSINTYGYRQIGFRRRVYLGHRLAWRIMTGGWPTGLIDHRNLIRADNKWVNLRLATPTQNNANWAPRRDLPRGVAPHKGRFQAQLKCKGKNHYLGMFDTPELAGRAYDVAATRLFGEHARLNFPEAA